MFDIINFLQSSKFIIGSSSLHISINLKPLSIAILLFNSFLSILSKALSLVKGLLQFESSSLAWNKTPLNSIIIFLLFIVKS